MFKFVKNKRVKWPVIINTQKDGGVLEEETLTAEFELIKSKEYNKLLDDGGDEAIARRVLVGWGDDVVDETGNPMPFSTEARDDLIQERHVLNGIVKAYVNCYLARESSAKN